MQKSLVNSCFGYEYYCEKVTDLFIGILGAITEGEVSVTLFLDNNK